MFMTFSDGVPDDLFTNTIPKWFFLVTQKLKSKERKEAINHFLKHFRRPLLGAISFTMTPANASPFSCASFALEATLKSV